MDSTLGTLQAGICCVKECSSKVRSRGFCKSHYQILYREEGDVGRLIKRRGNRRESAIEICDGFARVELTKGQWATIDIEDVELVRGKCWAASSNKKYALRVEIVDGKRKAVLMHRELIGAEEGEQVDHKDRNGLNNRRENIRKCTAQQNVVNRLLPRRIAIFRGTQKCRKQWRAHITDGSKYRVIGYFRSPEEAALAYNSEATRLYGDFAVLNDVNNPLAS